MREIRTLRAMWRALETGPSIRFTRQRSTLPGEMSLTERVDCCPDTDDSKPTPKIGIDSGGSHSILWHAYWRILEIVLNVGERLQFGKLVDRVTVFTASHGLSFCRISLDLNPTVRLHKRLLRNRAAAVRALCRFRQDEFECSVLVQDIGEY